MEVAQYKLRLNEMDEVKKAIDTSEKILDRFDSVETVIYASFYRVSAEYYKAKAEYAQYYKSALLYLACVNLDELSPEEKVGRAYDLAISALLGDMIYNFGELASAYFFILWTQSNTWSLTYICFEVVNAPYLGFFKQYWAWLAAVSVVCFQQRWYRQVRSSRTTFQ